MNLLAIETSTTACSAALMTAIRRTGARVDSGSVEVRERFEIAPRRHAELILPMVESLLADAGLRPASLDAVAFARGPGAFTGLRIAAGVAQGIAFAADLPVVPVSTLAALAYGAMTGKDAERVLAGLDARMNEVYWGAYRRDRESGVSLQDEERVCPAQEVPVPPGSGWFGAGNAWDTYESALRARLGAALSDWERGWHPRARDVAWLGLCGYRNGEAVPPDSALPVYLRDRVAVKPTRRRS